MFGIDRLQGRALYKAMSTACGAAFLLYGYDAGVLGGIQETEEFRSAIGNPTGSFVIPIIASIYNLSAGITALCVTFFGMKLGRKGTIQLGHVLICLGAVLQAATYGIGPILAGRLVAGAGIGCISSAVPTYMAEMSLEAKERGPEVSYQLALLISGIPLAYWIDLGFNQGLPESPWLWRIPLAMQSCFSIFSGGLLLFLPDTPRWYLARGRVEEGTAVLARLHNLPPTAEPVIAMRDEILSSLKDDDENGSLNPWLLLWDTSEYQFGRRLRTSFLITFAQQFLGINMLVYFSTQIFSQLGYRPLLASILAAVLNTIFAIASYPPIWYIEKVGRRKMMIWSGIGCGICMIAYVAVTTVDNPTDATRWTAVAFIILYEIVFAFGWLGTCWIYGPEISPLKYRHVAGALGASGEWFSTWIMVFGGGTGIDAVGPKIFIWPLICCFLAAAYVYFCCPETTGKTLEEIDSLFARTQEARDRISMEQTNRRASRTSQSDPKQKDVSPSESVEKTEFAYP